MKKKYYIYVYLDPRKQGNFQYGDLHFDHEPFYVGKGHGRRIYQHIIKSHLLADGNKHKANKINKILSEGHDMKSYISKPHQNLSDKESKRLEQHLISIIGRNDLGKGPLTNLTDGGEGSIGYHPTSETTAKIVAKAKGNKSRTGQIFSEEEREKHSIVMMGNKNWMSQDYEATKDKQSMVKRKLDNEQAKEILYKYNVLKTYTQQQLAIEYNVSRTCIRRILGGKIRTFSNQF